MVELLHLKDEIESRFDAVLSISQKGYLMFKNQKLVHQSVYISKNSMSKFTKYFNSTMEQMINELADKHKWEKNDSN